LGCFAFAHIFLQNTRTLKSRVENSAQVLTC
jgi:hypothetical protein